MDVHLDENEEQDALRELAKGEFKSDEKGARIMEYIAANINIRGFLEHLSEEMWLKEVLKDVQSPNAFVRTNALRMWGQYSGWLQKGKQKAAVRHEVEFGE